MIADCRLLIADSPSSSLSPGRLCRNSVHGSTSSPRTEYGPLEINYLAVHPEPVEGERRITTQSLEGKGGGEGAETWL